MSDEDRIAALEREVKTLKSDLALLGADLALVKSRVDQKAPKMVQRGGQPVVG